MHRRSINRQIGWAGGAGLWLLLAGFFALAWGQSFRFDNWTTDNGLPQNGVRHITQTQDSYLWFTTFDGLVRFDGIKFTVFNKNNSPALPGNRFTDIYEDKDGTLWALLEDDNLVAYRAGRFETIPLAFPGQKINFQHGPAGALTITAGGRTYAWDGQQFVLAPEYETLDEALYIGPSGARWRLNLELARQEANGKTTVYALRLAVHNTVQAKDLWISAAPYEDRRGALWVGDYTGVYRLFEGAIKHFPTHGILPPATALRAYCEDEQGGIWFASGPYAQAGAGLIYLLDGDFTVVGRESGLPDDYIFDVFPDREGNIWVATNKGLCRLRRQAITAYSTAQGLRNTEIYPLLRDTQGQIWVGTMAGLFRWDSVAETFSVLPQTETWPVQALWDDGRGRLWIGTVGGLYWRQNGRMTDVETLFPNDLDKLPDGRDWPTTNVIRSDKQGRVWVGTSNGLYQFDGNRVAAHYKTGNGLPGDDVKTLHETPDGTLWVGTYGGLARLKDGKFTVYTMADGLPSDKVRALYQTDDLALWIGTYDGGLARLRDGRFASITTAQGLFNDGVFAIMEDWRGYFWINCNKGIYQVSRAELEDVATGQATKVNSIAYGKADGMLNTEGNGGRQPSAIEIAGKFWLPTQDGVAVVDPYTHRRNLVPPSVHLESALVEREPVAWQPEVTLAPGQRNLEIAYTGVSFVKSEQVKFKYRLEGQDKDWVDAGTRRTAYYSYVPPGRYTFRVLAANADGVWSEQEAALRVVVEAAFYQTWWFRGLALLALGGAVLALYRYRLLQLRRQTGAQQEFSRKLIASQEAERQRIAAELHDGLGQNLLVIKNRAMLALLTENPNGAMKPQVEEISGMISQSIEEVRQIARNLRPYQLDRLGLTLALQSIATHLDETPGLECIGDIEDVDGLFAPAAEINLYRVVQECANNIIKHAQATRAGIIVERRGDTLAVTVLDNGRGFDGGAAQSGLGLSGLAERARILNAECVTISGRNQGTTFSLRIPLPRHE